MNELQHEGLKFLRDLHDPQGEGPDGWVELRAFGNDGSRKQDWFKDPTRMLDWVERLDKRSTGPSIFFGVGKRKARGGGSKEDVVSLPAVWADIDTGKLGLDWKSVARHLYDKPKFIRPSAIIHSGNGLHAYYFLNEPYVLTAKNTPLIEAVNVKVQQAMASDSVQDVSRVMRLPGTYNNKNRGKPSRAFIVYSDWWDRYDLDQINAAFTGLPMQIEGVRAPSTNRPGRSISERARSGVQREVRVGNRVDLPALWASVRYHGGPGAIGIDEAIRDTTAVLYRRGVSDEDIETYALDEVRRIKVRDAPNAHWDWDEERAEIRDKLERFKPKCSGRPYSAP